MAKNSYFGAYSYFIDALDLLLKAKARVDLPNNESDLVLHSFLKGQCCSETIIQKLVDAGADVNAKGKGKLTPLQLAVTDSKFAGTASEDTIQKLIALGADPKVVTEKGRGLLHIALESPRYNDLRILQILIENGVEVTHPDCDGNTPLHKLARYNLYDFLELSSAIQLFLQHGADKSAVNKQGQIPLHLNQKRGGSHAIALLEPEQMGDVADAAGSTLLHAAAASYSCFSGDKEVAHFMKILGQTKNPMATDEKGNTVLHIAANQGFHEAIVALPSDNVDAQNAQGNTALYLAVWALLRDQFSEVRDTQIGQFKEIVSVLKTPGKRFVVEEHFATLSYMRKRLAINALLDKGADSTISNKKGETAAGLCQSWLKLFGSNRGLREDVNL